MQSSGAVDNNNRFLIDETTDKETCLDKCLQYYSKSFKAVTACEFATGECNKDGCEFASGGGCFGELVEANQRTAIVNE